MLRDVFYFGNKPNAHPREKFAENLEQARSLATTEHFWIINEFCDYTNFEWDFDFDFLPDEDVWAQDHINVWPSVYQKDSGTWLVSDNDSKLIVYRNDVNKLKRKNIKTDNWVLLDTIDESKFDFGWHPDPTDPPYIYRWGNKYYPVELGAALEYHMPGATDIKYMKSTVELLPDWRYWQVPDYIDKSSFDFSWRPDPREPEMIYDFGTQWHRSGGPRYVMPDATEIKYIEGMKARALPRPNDPCWTKVDGVDLEHFDYTWYPDHNDQPYIYVFGNQFYKAEIMPSMEYRVPGATEIKYVNECWGSLAPNKSNWIIPENIDDTGFSYSWVPNPYDPPYIYEFGTQWQKTGGPRYVVEDATEVKYVDIQKVKKLPDMSNWQIPENIDTGSFDFSWHPDDTAPPFIYQFSTQWSNQGGPRYVVEDATEIEYVDIQKAIALPDLTKWQIPDDIHTDKFDFSWTPSVEDKPYIYQFGTQHQKTGGPRYVLEGATEIKYVESPRAIKLAKPEKFKFITDLKIESFDYTWHPDDTDQPYIYVFGNNHYDAEVMPTVEYHVEGATDIKYVNDIRAKLSADKSRWIIPKDIDDSNFDYSWIPNPKDPAYVYQFGTQHQKTGGPRYEVPNAVEIKYMDKQVRKLPDKSKFTILNDYIIEKFDWSWHPDDTAPPYNYVFGNQHYDAEYMPTIEYRMEGASFSKYLKEPVAKLGQDKRNWIIPKNIDVSEFDFSWKPDPGDPPFIYRFGTQWQKTGGPSYNVEKATDIKYVEGGKAKALPNQKDPRWKIPENIDISEFDFSWHPDTTERPFVYQFGTQHQKTGGPRYVMPGASDIKYVEENKARALPNGTYWDIPDDIDIDNFDFSWHPDETAPPYIYQFGTQWQKTGGPRYTHPDSDENTKIMYVNTQRARHLPSKANWLVPDNIDPTSIDYSWHPDDTEEPYIYQFGTQWHDRGGPKYTVQGAKTYKYLNDIKGKTLPDRSNWDNLLPIDEDKFDYTWVPHPFDPPYIYVFGNQWNSAEIEPTMEYRVAGATETKYVHDIKATVLPDKTHWKILHPIDENKFDFSWRPNPKDPAYIYVFGNNKYPAERMPTVQYVAPGASDFKYIADMQAELIADKKNFTILHPIDESKFDFSWMPDPGEPPYIYVFGNQHYKPEVMPTVEYRVDGATTIKYVEDAKAILLPNKDRWIIPKDIDDSNFDYSWVPDPGDPPYVYVAGTQWQKTGGPKYVVEGATEFKYINQKVTKLPDRSKFEIVQGLKIQNFDFSWHPDDTDPPYVYVFGNTQYDPEVMPTIKYTVKGGSFIKYVHDVVAKLANDMTNWIVPDNIDTSSFDFSWKPHPDSPPYIYEFATVWNNRGGPIYKVDKATDKKYIEDIKAKTKASKNHWQIPDKVDVSDFDFSWVPHPDAPPYIYQFGTLMNDQDGPIYHTPNNNGEIVRLPRVYVVEETKVINENDILNKDIPIYTITVSLDDLVYEHPDEVFWAVRDNIDYSKFDFTWRPNIEQARYVHVFGSPDSEITQTYFISAPMYMQGYKDFNYVEQDKKADEDYLATLFKPSDMFYVDRGNVESKDRFELLKHKYPNIQKTRFLNSWVDTINRCINRSNTELCWILNSELDYNHFNFNYYPNEWQLKMVHVFGTQWSHWGTTFMVNRDTFAEDTKYIKVIEHLNNLNFVKERRAFATNNLYDIILIDHGNTDIDNVKNKLIEKSNGKNISVIKYDGAYLKTIRDAIKKLPEKKEHYLWICSSICDYTDFDFSFITDPFARDNLHVFPSDTQKFGDTFLVDVNTAKEVIDNLEKLQAYPKVAYIPQVKAKRLPAPVVHVDSETHAGMLDVEFTFPYMIFATEDVEVKNEEHISLWDDESKNIIVTSTGASRIIVPREAKDIVKNELYDYPYIKTASKLSKSKPLDIVFLSNGELCADENYEHLLAVTKGLGNRVVRVDGVDGRVQGYHAALEASETPWAFTVFAKLKVNNKFDWNWQPDRLQIPKHYIFNAKNPVTGLVYGHQAMIAYNKKLTLANMGKGLDFTLDDPHESVDMLSGIATFNTDPYSTWRTAFREVIKLKSDYSEIAEERLNAWLKLGEGDFAENCLQGANDAVEFYDSVMGDIEELKKSYEWAWLKDYYRSKYK